MMILAATAALCLLGAIGIPALKRASDSRTIIVYIVLLICAGYYAMRHLLGMDTYGPLEGLMHMVRVGFNISLSLLCGEGNGI